MRKKQPKKPRKRPRKKLKKSFIILVDDVINSGKTMQYALVKFLEHPTKTILATD